MSNNIGHNTNNIKTYTRGVGQQHTSSSVAKRTPNKYDLNGYKAYKFGNMRAALNKNGSIFNARGGVIVNQGGGASNKAANIMNGVMAGLMVGKTVANIFASSKNVVNSFDGKGGVESTNTSVASTTLTGKLSSASSFSEINSLKQQAATQKQNLNTDYKKIDNDCKSEVDQLLQNEKVKSGMQLAGVELSTEALELSDLDPNDLEKSIETIDKDINNVTNFQTSDVKKAQAGVAKKTGEVTQQITSVTSQITKLESQKISADESQKTTIEDQIKELEKQKEDLEEKKNQLDKATEALGKVETQCGKTLEALGKKKDEVSDLKKFEDDVKDKEYDLAKSQDEQLKQTMDKIDKLTKEIDSLEDNDKNKADSSDQKRLQKYNSLIQERSGLYDTLGNLTSSLASAGETKFENSKGKEYTLQYLDKALNYGKDSSTSSTSTATAATGGGATSTTTSTTTKAASNTASFSPWTSQAETVTSNFANLSINDKIEIAGETYIKCAEDTFMPEQGGPITYTQKELEEMQRPATVFSFLNS